MDYDPNMEPMELLIYEDTTLLVQLDQILLDSEKTRELRQESINEIFRIMHTIKGSAAMMGLGSISTLSHAVEDVFAIIREHPQTISGLEEVIFDLVFQASDFLKSELESLQTTGEALQDPSALSGELRQLAATLSGGLGATTAPSKAPAPPPALETAAVDAACRIRVFFDDESELENIRAFMLLNQLKDLCDELDSIPPHPESDSSLCEGIHKDGFEILCKPTHSIDDLRHVIESSVNVKSYEIFTNDQPVAEEKHPNTVEISVHPDTVEASPAFAVGGSGHPTSTTQGTTRPVQSLISVNQSKLDHLMDLVGELVTTESMVVNNPDLRGLRLDNYTKSARELRKLTDELQDVVMSMRMVPLSGIFQKMNRIVRDMSKSLDKKVELVTIGGDTEVDKTINETIGDPLMHMVRNAMDHAIELPETRLAADKPETGTITLSAQNVGGEIVIIIADDGCGLDRERILQKAAKNGLLTKPESEYSDREAYSMILLPGFSTNQQVTEYSGRGVGMDVVQKNIEKVGGMITIDSVRGEGTTFTLNIPLTLAIVDGMELTVGGTVFIIPITSIRQAFRLSPSEKIVEDAAGCEMILIRGECLPIIRLHQNFQIASQVTNLEDGIFVLIENGHKAACLFADELLGEQQVVVKPFPTFFNKYPVKQMGLSGCTILGDGSISLILDTNNFLTHHA